MRDLVDALDLDYASVSVSGDSGANLFVTEHEVLLLKRQMGCGTKGSKG
jgi:hypothetical protein